VTLSFTPPAGYRRNALLKARAAASNESADRALSPSSAKKDEVPAENVVEIAPPALHATSGDSAFRELVAKADRHRDEREWRKAEEAYRGALALDPRQAGYWVQHGHMCKEQGHFAEAEISYRSGAALGVEPRDVIEHLRFVMARQGSSEGRFPIRFGKAGTGPAAQVPTEADIRMLARLVWRVDTPPIKDVLKLLRENATCDDAFAAMVADTRFEQANVNWLALVKDGEL
jgi:hypothetical protein